MTTIKFEFKAKLWRWQAETGTAWHFITLPEKIGSDIKKNWGNLKAGFGSIRVTAQIGNTQWQTSIFPDSKSGSYLLPVKAAVRKAEGVKDGDLVGCWVWVEG